MKRILILFGAGVALQAIAAPLSQETAIERAQEWMQDNPIMENASGSVASVEKFPTTGTNYWVYVVHLSPTGYLVLNSDDQLPLVVAFSAESGIDLSDTPDNAFRAMLLQHVSAMEEQLAQPNSTVPPPTLLERQAVTEIYGPFLETAWNQCNPYNKLCPTNPAPDGTEYYDYRAAVGCVPTAYAQVLGFHRWPYFGEGSHTYTDNSGSMTGTHSADFSDPYDWSNMLPSYDAWDPNPAATEDAIAELMYELGVSVDANYESGGTGASTRRGGERLEDYFFFEACQWNSSSSSLMTPLEADLRAGFPCVVSIPNHAIVADGLMVDDGTTTYHFNYGWGGSNNGWMDASQLEDGATSLRPRLMAFPQSNAVSVAEGMDTEVRWILPKRREDEVGKLAIYRLKSGSWELFAEDTALLSRRYSAIETPWDECADFSEFEITSTSTNKDWTISTTSGVANCFYKQPGGYSNREYHLTSHSTITPTASTYLALHAKYNLANDRFRVLLSTDRSTFTEIWSAAGTIDWSDIKIDLSAYAGQAVYVRLEYVTGSYYSDGGIWIDSIGTLEVTHPELEGQPVHYTVLENLEAGSYTLAAKLVDTDQVEHALGPQFTLEVTGDGDGMPADWEIQYGLDPEVDDGALDPDGDGYNNLDEYICGTVPTNADSCWLLQSGTGNLPSFYAIEGRLYTIKYRTALTSGSWQPLVSDIPGENGTISVSDYDSATNAARYYRVKIELEN